MAAHGIDFDAEEEIRAGVGFGHSRPDVVTVLVSESSLLHTGLRQVLAGTVFRLAERVSAAFLSSHRDLAKAPALIVIDANRYCARMPELAEQVKDRFPRARLIALADRFDFHLMPSWHDAGVDGFCLVESRSEILINSLELVMLGESTLPSAAARSVLAGLLPGPGLQTSSGEAAGAVPFADPKGWKLTLREAEILRHLMSGDSNKVIARHLDVTEATIKVHVKTILRKTGLTNRTQAALWAREHLLPRTESLLQTGADRP